MLSMTNIQRTPISFRIVSQQPMCLHTYYTEQYSITKNVSQCGGHSSRIHVIWRCFIVKGIRILRWNRVRTYQPFMRCIDPKDIQSMKSSIFIKYRLISESFIMFRIIQWEKGKTLELGAFL